MFWRRNPGISKGEYCVLLLREEHQVSGKCEAAFEETLRDE